ncbi:MurR/RpiR family transcriptional regulator [Numidum massiliense]|uniref:MurR/RpiR family transcriptional regulator n=1 Tax=Numidum massiliense TaxID=1522315 RepID=UPI0006D5A000|nr:MurR/RpiR family transcriptional regulator [Numidum massiliense]
MTYRKKTQQHYDNLTKGLKKVGEALLADPALFATHPAKTVARAIDVSETMVIRFCQAIGFNGYSDLQKDVQRALLTVNPPDPDADANRANETQATNPFAAVMATDEQTIELAARTIEWSVAEDIVEQLVAASAVSVVGYYHSFAFAHWFSFLLGHLLDNVTLYRPETDIGITKKGTNDCVALFSYYRYALATIRLAEEAKANGLQVIVITDTRLSPIADYADYILTIQTSKKSVLEKGPVTFSVLNALLLHIAQKVGKLEFVNPTNKYFIQ